MAWNEMKYRIVEIKGGLQHPFEVKPQEFESVEEAVEVLKTYAPSEFQQYIIVPLMSFSPDR